GRGQEPDKETMDYIISKIPLSYFDGKLGAGRASSLLLKIAIDRIQDIRDIKSTNIKNAIYNGTFSRNLPSFGWTHDGTARNTENGKFQIIGIGSNNLIQVHQITDLEYRDGDKIYMSAEYT